MIALIPEEDWKDQVQIIGWLYQYYNSEKKDEVFAALKKNVKITKENIPAAISCLHRIGLSGIWWRIRWDGCGWRDTPMRS